MDLIPLKFAAAKLGLSKGYVRRLCRERRLPGAMFDGRRWLVPDGARVIRKASGLYRVAGDQASAESKKMAELDHRMQRLATALAAVEGSEPDDEGNGSMA